MYQGVLPCQAAHVVPKLKMSAIYATPHVQKACMSQVQPLHRGLLTVAIQLPGGCSLEGVPPRPLEHVAPQQRKPLRCLRTDNVRMRSPAQRARCSSLTGQCSTCTHADVSQIHQPRAGNLQSIARCANKT